MNIPEPKIKKSFFAEIEAILGECGYSTTDADRLSYARDSNFRATIQAYYNKHDDFPSLIVWPETTEQLALLVKSAIKHDMPITPFGGGSGVCGGTISKKQGMIVDLKRMNRLLRIDKDRLFIDAQPGILGLNLENRLSRNGLTLGHFPSSILSASLGGYLATRSAGQMSSKYGKIEDMVIDLEFIDGQGQIHQTADISRHHGIDLTQTIVGSEGTFGIITKARLKVFPKPNHRHFASYRFNRLFEGLEAMRRIMQSGIPADVLRLYDELDTAIVFQKLKKEDDTIIDLTKNMPDPLKNTLGKLKNLSMKTLFRNPYLVNQLAPLAGSGCVLIVMLEGHEKLLPPQIQIIESICEVLGAENLGEKPARHWLEHRYSVSYKASTLFAQGAYTDTMECACSWDKLETLYTRVKAKLNRKAIVLAHISHVYPEGAAIYFTFVAPLIGLNRTIKHYDKLWDTALKTVQDCGAVLSHHHGIGRLKKPHIAREWQEAQLVYKKLKSFFDPHGILNPGVLYDS